MDGNPHAKHEESPDRCAVLQTVLDSFHSGPPDRPGVVGDHQRHPLGAATRNRRHWRRRADEHHLEAQRPHRPRRYRRRRVQIRDARADERRQPLDGVRFAQRSLHASGDAGRGVLCTNPHRRHHGAPYQRLERGSNGGRSCRDVPRQHDHGRLVRAVLHAPHRRQADAARAFAHALPAGAHDQNGKGDPRSVRGGSGTFLDAHHPGAGESQRSADRPRVPPGSSRDSTVRRDQRSVPRAEHVSGKAMGNAESTIRVFRGTGRGHRPRRWRSADDQGHDFRGLVRRLRHVSHHAHVADDRARLGRQPVSAWRCVDGSSG